MSYLKWGGKKYYPQKPKPYKADINDLMKPLGEKSRRGNVWGSVIMNVEKDDSGPTPTPIPFSPSDISGLTNWWESDTGVITDGDGVLSWTDSISSNVATRVSTNFNNTTDVLNGYSGITQTDLSNQPLTLSSTISLSATTIFVVVKQNSIPNVGYIMGESNGGLYMNFDGGTPNGIYNNPDICDGGTDITTEQYFTYQMDATDYYLRQNGSQVGTSPIVSGGNLGFDRLYQGNSFPLRGTIWEILVYDRALNGTEIGDVETYIQNKYFPPVTPTPTPSMTPTMTVTPSPTVTNTPTVTTTPTPTPSAVVLPSISFITSAELNNSFGQTTYNFNGIDTGDDGLIVVAYHTYDNGNVQAPPTATIDGNTMNFVVLGQTLNRDPYSQVTIYYFRKTTTGTSNFSFTATGDARSAGLGVWNIQDVSSDTPISSSSNTSHGSTISSLAITLTGLTSDCVGLAALSSQMGAVTWTNVVEDYEFTLDYTSGSASRATAGDFTQSTSSDRTITASFPSALSRISMAGAAWR